MFYTPTQYFITTLIIGLIVIIYYCYKEIEKLKTLLKAKI